MKIDGISTELRNHGNIFELITKRRHTTPFFRFFLQNRETDIPLKIHLMSTKSVVR